MPDEPERPSMSDEEFALAQWRRLVGLIGVLRVSGGRLADPNVSTYVKEHRLNSPTLLMGGIAAKLADMLDQATPTYDPEGPTGDGTKFLHNLVLGAELDVLKKGSGE